MSFEPGAKGRAVTGMAGPMEDRKSTRLNSSNQIISYAVFCLKKIHAHARLLHPLRPRLDVVRDLSGQRLRSAAHVLRAHLGEPFLPVRPVEFFFYNDTGPPDVRPLPLHKPLPT